MTIEMGKIPKSSFPFRIVGFAGLFSPLTFSANSFSLLFCFFSSLLSRHSPIFLLFFSFYSASFLFISFLSASAIIESHTSLFFSLISNYLRTHSQSPPSLSISNPADLRTSLYHSQPDFFSPTRGQPSWRIPSG
ncbi:hypothetical protein NE237_023319 [Protea cynaroides]|uniref:Uncharacterized protein n=1 Tax=Protea cynaroides TaxID=273540 RepID=A0A9Q0K621_9MAGN|nr:hypothetical protein NE237_023319 [Protea cynaroides]